MRAYLSLGSNLGSPFGDRRQTVLWGARALAEMLPARLIGISSVYRTEPVGDRNQPDFANLVAAYEVVIEPLELLAACLEVERRALRRRVGTRGPRSLDLDILLLGHVIAQSTELTIPHPRLHERRFVLQPLVEVAPNAEHPVLRRSATELLADLMDPSLVRLWYDDGGLHPSRMAQARGALSGESSDLC